MLRKFNLWKSKKHIIEYCIGNVVSMQWISNNFITWIWIYFLPCKQHGCWDGYINDSSATTGWIAMIFCADIKIPQWRMNGVAFSLASLAGQSFHLSCIYLSQYLRDRYAHNSVWMFMVPWGCILTLAILWIFHQHHHHQLSWHWVQTFTWSRPDVSGLVLFLEHHY